MKDIKRAIIFVHYDRDNRVDDYLYYYLKELQKNASHLVFVSTAKLSHNDIETLSQYCSKVITRDNIGYDFMSYKVGLDSFDYQSFDEIVICNDSVYGPFYPLKNLFTVMHNKKCDFWGITDNIDMGYHLQSYFLVVKKNVISSPVFQEFWDKVKVLKDKDSIIEKYEVGFTQALLKAGFKVEVATLFQPTTIQKLSVFIKKFTPNNIVKKITSILSGEAKMMRIGKLNTTHYFWKELLVSGDAPFIKIELLRDNPMNINIDDFEKTIHKVSNYDTKLIKNHLNRMKQIK